MNNFTPVASLAGGLLIGAASVWLLAANGRIAGVSGILQGFGLGWAAAAGLLVGFGTRVGGGCTSGHGVAVAVFMATGIAAAVITRHVLGVPS